MNTYYSMTQKRKKRKSMIVYVSIIAILAGVAVYYIATAEKRAYQNALAADDNHKYELFLVKYPHSGYQAEIYTAMYRQAKGNAAALLKLGELHPDIIETCPVFEDACRLLYQEASAKNTMEGWDDFLHTIEKVSPVDVEEYREKVIEQKSLLAFASEKAAWEFVSANKSAYLCEKYMLAFPKGKHVQECSKLLIDLEIDAVFASGEYGELPPMEKASMGMTAIGNNHSVVTVHNDTEYKLTVSYGGNAESKQLVLAPREKGSLRLPNGQYKIVASVSSSMISNYAGEETLTGDIYGIRYYIDTQYSNSYMSDIKKYKRMKDGMADREKQKRQEMFQRLKFLRDSIANMEKTRQE